VRESRERRFDGFASLVVNRNSHLLGQHESDKTPGTGYRSIEKPHIIQEPSHIDVSNVEAQATVGSKTPLTNSPDDGKFL
jgi:hypothetical protein